jgi:release factor glutamine methyltransferase
MTIAEALHVFGKRLDYVGGSGRLDVLLLLESITGGDRTDFVVDDQRELTLDEEAAFAQAVALRSTGVPIAYITKSVGFFGRTFAVDSRVLVPRPETEHLVEAALDDLRKRGKSDPRVADIGTGSGVIAISIAAEIPGAWVFGTDISRGAIGVARHNAAANNVFQECTFLHGDLAAPLERFAPFDCLIANLPYIPTADLPAAPDPVGFEPRLALDGGIDGLELYRRLVAQLPALLAPRAFVLFEAAPGTIEPLALLVRTMFPGSGATVHADYAGLGRYVTFRNESS